MIIYHNNHYHHHHDLPTINRRIILIQHLATAAIDVLKDCKEIDYSNMHHCVCINECISPTQLLQYTIHTLYTYHVTY